MSWWEQERRRLEGSKDSGMLYSSCPKYDWREVYRKAILIGYLTYNDKYHQMFSLLVVGGIKKATEVQGDNHRIFLDMLRDNTIPLRKKAICMVYLSDNPQVSVGDFQWNKKCSLVLT